MEFNDPFECQAITVIEKGAEGKRYLRDGVKGLGLSVADRIQKIKQLEGKQGKPMLPADFPLLSDLVRKIGVSCFSDERDNILMWAHYSDNHSGVCLGFNTSRHLFQTAWQVQYQEQLPVLNRPSDSHDTLLEKSLLTKSAQWGYEREWRIIRRTLTVDESSYLERKYAGASREQLEVALRQSGPGFYSFPKEAISEVCLGVKMTPDKKKTVIGWVKDAGLAK